jgi:thiol:disulfide interchange protein
MKGILAKIMVWEALVGVLVILGAFNTPTSSQSVPAAETEIQWVTLDELHELNKKEPRKVFIDIYATWCGPCKLMDKKTFADPEIVQYVNENYYAVKLNGEGKSQVSIFGKTMTEAELAYAFQIRGYPSTVFMTEELKPYQPVAGYIPAKEFLRMLKQFNES